MTEWTKDAIPLGGDPNHFPPYSDECRDAEIESLRFAFLEMAGALHAAGVLDMAELAGRLGNSVWVYEKKPRTLASVQWLADSLLYLRAKSGVPEADQ